MEEETSLDIEMVFVEGGSVMSLVKSRIKFA
jgi:hypothetical protein